MVSGMPDDGLYATSWAPPEPSGLPGLRAAMARYMNSQHAVAHSAQTVAMGKGALFPAGRTAVQAAQILCDNEYRRLRDATLYYVAADMTELAVTAGESLPNFHLEPEDVPSPTGFVVFAEPIGSYVSSDADPPERIPIVAASWGPFSAAHLPRGGVWVTHYAPTDFPAIERMALQRIGRPMREHERTRLHAGTGPLTWDNETVLGYGGDLQASFKPGDSHSGPGDTIAPWIQTLRATWLLMNQPSILEVDDLPQDRAAARRARRDGLAASPVRLLHLRRATRNQGAPDGESAARAYTCRWMVRGHWRQQWYPTRGVHRPLWINPHLKGPDGKPLRTGDTVHVLDR
ncbi:hypothetical protein IHE48_38500 [Frankia sp. CH37]|nr:hypothetical protein [Parafrankia sp. CH37]